MGRMRGAVKSQTLYRRYIERSRWWKYRRDEYVKTHPICEGCGIFPTTQVHHVNYCFFEETDADLGARCGNCHKGYNKAKSYAAQRRRTP